MQAYIDILQQFTFYCTEVSLAALSLVVAVRKKQKLLTHLFMYILFMNIYISVCEFVCSMCTTSKRFGSC